jgi:hypothetical protein
MEGSLEKASQLGTEHSSVLSDAFRSTSEDLAREVQPCPCRCCNPFTHTIRPMIMTIWLRMTSTPPLLCLRGKPAVTLSHCSTERLRRARMPRVLLAARTRAPLTLLQVFVSGGYYSFGVDVWSMACIMAELMRCYCIACESERHELVCLPAWQLAWRLSIKFAAGRPSGRNCRAVPRDERA